MSHRDFEESTDKCSGVSQDILRNIPEYTKEYPREIFSRLQRNIKEYPRINWGIS
jgi:hypothetical protein